MKTRFALVMLAALFVTAAQAAPVPPNTVVKAPDWSAGSEWHYSDGYAVKVNDVSAKGATFERLDAPGQFFTRQGFIRTDSVSGTATRNAIYRTVPDTAGLSLSAAKPLTFQREYLKNGKLVVHASSWSVEGRETITVPAGSFDCWVIVWRTRSMKSDWTGFERWWYSPQAQSYVRMEYKYGPDEDGSRVLMTYNLSGSQPVSIGPPVPEPVSAPVAPPAPVAASRPAIVVTAPIPAPVKQDPVKAAPVKQTKVTAPVQQEILKPVPQIRVAAPAVKPSIKKETIAASAPVLAEEPSPVLAERKVQPAPWKAFELTKVEIAPVTDMPIVPDASAKAVMVAALSLGPVKEKPQDDASKADDVLADNARASDSALPEEPSAPAPAKVAEIKPARPRPPALPKDDKAGPWHAHFGTSMDAANVRSSLKNSGPQSGAHALPSGVTVREIEGRTFYRAWLGSYDSAPEARSLCDALNIKKVRISGCTVFKGPTTMEARAN